MPSQGFESSTIEKQPFYDHTVLKYLYVIRFPVFVLFPKSFAFAKLDRVINEMGQNCHLSPSIITKINVYPSNTNELTDLFAGECKGSFRYTLQEKGIQIISNNLLVLKITTSFLICYKYDVFITIYYIATFSNLKQT